jgi:hypothetical protein
MSDLASALGSLSNTGLEFFAVSQGQPLSVSNSVVGGVPVSTSSVGSLVTPGSISTTTIVFLAIAAIALYFLFKAPRSAL